MFTPYQNFKFLNPTSEFRLCCSLKVVLQLQRERHPASSKEPKYPGPEGSIGLAMSYFSFPMNMAQARLAESGKAILRRLNEKRSAWPSFTDIHSHSLSKPSIVEEQTSSTIPIPAASRSPFESLERCPFNLEDRISTFDLPADISMLVDREMAFHEDDLSCLAPLFETALASSRKGESASVARASDVPASTSADIGLRLLVQAINERGERFLYLDSETSFEATMSVDLTLGEAPSFLNDTCEYLQFILFVRFSSNSSQWIYPLVIPRSLW